MQVRDCQHQDIALVDSVVQAVRELAEATPANDFAQRMPRPGKAHNAVCDGQHLDEERVSQTGSLLAVSVDGFVRLDLGNIEKPDRHGLYLAMTSPSFRAATSPRR